MSDVLVESPNNAVLEGPSGSIDPYALHDILDTALSHASHNTWATSANGYELNYERGGYLVGRLVTGLRAAGVQKGDRIALCMPNHIAYPIVVSAAWRIGATIVGLNALYSGSMLSLQIEDCRPTLIFVQYEGDLIEKIEGTASKVGAKLIGVEADATDLLDMAAGRTERAGVSREGVEAIFDFMGERSETGVALIEPISDLALLQYTGGTTGVPKGAMLTHANISANLQQLAVYLPNLEYGQEKFLAVGPFSHIIGMTTVMTLATRYGSEIVMVDRFHPEETTKLCLEQGITMLVGVPTMLAAMNQSEAGRSGNWTALKYVIAGGAPLPLNIKNTFEAMTGARVLTGYGLSETSPAACLTPPDRDPPEGSTGAPMAGTTIEVRDEADVTQTRQINETGEICIRGPQVMVGYWEREDATAETLIEDGLLRTGDIGKIDEHGNVFLVDRLKDIIIASGFNVYPSVIEDALYEHPDIAQAAAIGVPDSYRGETVKAVVVMKPGTKPLDLEALKTFLTGRLSPIEMPKQLELRDALPMSPAGKVLRKDLKG